MKKVFSVMVLGFCLSMTAQAESKKFDTKSGVEQQTGQQDAMVINLAGQQRMLTQKMSKEALLIAKGIEVKDNRKNLQETITLFDKILKGLINGDANLKLPKTQNKEILTHLKIVTKLWKSFKEHVDLVAMGKTEKLTLQAIDKENLPLLKQINIVVEMYEENSISKMDPQMAKTLNLAGRQRMLTQKMTKELLLIANRLHSNANTQSLKNGGELFKTTLENLMNNRKAIQDPEIASRLVNVQALWNQYQDIIANTDISKGKGFTESKEEQKKISTTLTKELIEIANLADAKIYIKNLKNTGELFNKTLTALINGDATLGIQASKDEEIKEQLHKVQKLWSEYKEIIIKADVSEAGLKKAIAINIPLLENMNKVVKMYEISSR